LRSTYPRNTFLRIPFASATLSATTDNTRGDCTPIRSSRANLTAAMIDAQMATVELKRSHRINYSCIGTNQLDAQVAPRYSLPSRDRVSVSAM
jgi:hypothetical protein